MLAAFLPQDDPTVPLYRPDAEIAYDWALPDGPVPLSFEDAETRLTRKVLDRGLEGDGSSRSLVFRTAIGLAKAVDRFKMKPKRQIAEHIKDAMIRAALIADGRTPAEDEDFPPPFDFTPGAVNEAWWDGKTESQHIADRAAAGLPPHNTCRATREALLANMARRP